MKLLGWRSLPHSTSTLRGFVDVELQVENDRRLQILECPVHDGPNGPWVGLPRKVQIDRDGTVRLKADGRRDYAAILQWGDRAASDAFSEAVIKVLLRRHRDALDPAEATA